MYKLNSEDGFSGGLITWGLCILVFALLGVPAVLSILVGLAGGVAVGAIIAYWRAEKSDEAAKPVVEEPEVIQPVRRLVQLPQRIRMPRVLRSKSPKRIGK